MPLDALAIAAVRGDLERRIIHARIERVAQPGRGELLFTLRRGAAAHLLRFSADLPWPWVGLVRTPPPSPANPPSFCMLLRKYLGGGRLLRLAQPPCERLLGLVVEHYDEIGAVAEFTLWLELFGRRGNAVLVNAAGAIVDALRRTGPEAARPLEPGAVYAPPDSAGRLNPLELAADTFANLLRHAPAGTPLGGLLQRKLVGLSRETIAAIIAGAGLNPDLPAAGLPLEDAARLWHALSGLLAEAAAGRFSPRVITDGQGRAVDVSALPIILPPGWSQEPVDAPAEAAGRVYADLARDELAGRLRTRLLARARSELAKIERKRAKQLAEESAAAGADRYREYGDLIYAHLAEIPRQADRVLLPSFTAPGIMVEIPLDPALAPGANAQAHYRRYQRAKRGQNAIAAQLARTNEEAAYLEQLIYSLETAETAPELAEIETEMASAGLLPRPAQKAARPLGPRAYLSADGCEILVGRNSRQNDHLTFTLAGPGDIWLHAREIPGSHVIVKTAGYARPPEATLRQAALLAAYYSGARGGTKVPVDYTARRHVRKRAGGRPGLVTYDHFETAIVDALPEALAGLVEIQPDALKRRERD
ncbi:MAG: NFACT family protein [Patescibacteria group bacterium]